MSQSNDTVVPRHLGLILDGNRRWARTHGLPIAEGHRQGFENVKTITRFAFDSGVEYLSAFIFSTENWKRSKDEVEQLMRLFLWVARHEARQLHKEGIRLRVIGSRARLGKALVKAIHDAEVLTENNTRGTLLLCLDYGGQQEIVEAAKAIAEKGIPPEDITVETIEQHLYAPDVPPIDLLIRTSGEQRLSNFMLWQAAYSELMFSDQYWPDFRTEDLQEMFTAYESRQRRFGQ